jgi:DNA-binding beta-propeller fold protein YncE
MRGIFLQVVGTLMGTAFSAAVTPQAAHAAESMPLQLEAKISLGDVKGRIDHMAVDLDRQRLFVAELGNDSIGIVDLSASKVSGRLRGLKEPQGVGYVPSTDTLYVANAGDGSVRLFQGQDLKETGRIDLGDDADNVRIDSAGNRVIVGYGEGALAIIDDKDNRKISEIGLDGHPESFRLESGGSRVFVNVPDAHAIEVADRESGKVVARWPTGGSSANFPMALDEASQQVLVVFRNPPTLTAYSMLDGANVASAKTCGIRTTCSWMQSGAGSTWAVARATWMPSSRMRAPFVGLPIFPPLPAHAPRCSFPNWIACSWPCGRETRSRPRSGPTGRAREKAGPVPATV